MAVSPGETETHQQRTSWPRSFSPFFPFCVLHMASLFSPSWGCSCRDGGEPEKAWILEERTGPGARTSELVPSVPGASGIMRSGSWFRVSPEGSAIWVDLPQAPKGGQGWRCAKCPSLSHQRPDPASWDWESLDLIKMGQAQEQRARQRLTN